MPADVINFTDAADDYIKAYEPSWRNAKHAAQWRMTLKDYAGPHLGKLAVAAVKTQDVMTVLTPMWLTTPETASRLRGRIEAMLDYARVQGWREGENPARWRGHLDELLPRRSEVRAVKHPAALPWQDVAAFLTALRSQESISARALEVPILTAARSGEILGMHWGEVDREGAVWTVPADRMKARREHRVALSEAAVAILRTMEKLRATEAPDAYVFPGRERSRPLSIMSMPMLLRRMNHADLTVHGFRSCFRDWVGETTAHPREVVEAALAHRTGDKVEQAYARGDLFTKRRKLMTDWAQFCARDPGGIVLQMRPAALDAPCSTVAQYPGEPGRHF